MEKIFLVECYIYKNGKETSHYVAQACRTKKRAKEIAKQLLDDYQAEGYELKKGNDINLVGWVKNNEESRFYWIDDRIIMD